MRRSISSVLLLAGHAKGDECQKVYSQVTESDAFANCGSTISNDCHVKDGEDFIDFRGWENHKEYNFELRYTSSSNNALVTWTQTENPFSIYDAEATVSNLSATLNGENYSVIRFHGLSVSSNSATLLDGQVGNNWWYSVGNEKSHRHNTDNGNPALSGIFSASLSELYICQPKGISNDVEAYWTSYSPWGECSVTCAGGVSTRSRICIGRGECVGVGTDSKLCNEKICEPACNGQLVYKQTSTTDAFMNCGGSINNECYVIDGEVNYIDFRGLADLPNYRFELYYFSGTEESSVKWTQSENPFSVTDGATVSSEFLIKTMNGVDMPANYGSFHGLSLSTNTATLLDGNIGNNWWYAVGNSKDHKGGIPGFFPLIADRSELYICLPEITTEPYWTSYGQFSKCSVSCGGGTSTRTRRCMNGEAGEGNCVGEANESVVCQTRECEPECYRRQVYYQTSASDAFINCGNAGANNGCHVHDGENFIDFRGLEDFDSYRFQLYYTGNDGSSSAITWTQAENPFSLVDTEIATVSKVLKYMNGEEVSESTGSNFAGLRYSTRALLDGNQGNNWWYSVGNNREHGGGNPGVTPMIAAISEMFICLPEPPTSPPTVDECTPVGKPNKCASVTTKFTQTNTWVCRNCFNLRIEFSLNSLGSVGNKFESKDFIFVEFDDAAFFLKAAYPAKNVKAIDTSNKIYKIEFSENFNPGDKRVDVNIEFSGMGVINPSVNAAELCPYCAKSNLINTEADFEPTSTLDELDLLTRSCLYDPRVGNTGALAGKFKWFNKVTRNFLGHFQELKFEAELQKDRFTPVDYCSCLGDGATAYSEFFDKLDKNQVKLNRKKRAIEQVKKVQFRLRKKGCNL